MMSQEAIEGTDETAEAEDENEEGRTENVVDGEDLEEQFPDEEPGAALPDWVDIPADMNIPEGVQVGLLRFKASWTMVAGSGDRTCVVWPLTDLDERLAHQRCKDNWNAAASELAKQMIRIVDGVKVNHGAKRGKAGNIDDFWREIGPKCRTLVTRYWRKTHTMDAAEASYFFEHCVAVRTMG